MAMPALVEGLPSRTKATAWSYLHLDGMLFGNEALPVDVGIGWDQGECGGYERKG
jgi:hypothetical protein